MWLFALFLAVPLIEIALFVEVGGAIGLWPTLLIVVLTAVLGTALMRNQGALAMAQIRDSFNTLRDPAEPLAHGAMILFAGALLLTPGFFTDSLGFALLLPPVRRAVYRWLGKRVQVQGFSAHAGAQTRSEYAPGEVIDGEFTEVSGGKRPTHRPSGWTRH